VSGIGLKEKDIKCTSSMTQICWSVCKDESWRTNCLAVSLKNKVCASMSVIRPPQKF
jgi:hypothetical protein